MGMEGESRLKVLAISSVVVFGGWLLAWLLPLWLLPTWELRNQFGGMFGSVASLFSGLALLGLVYTIYLQHRQIERSQADLVETRRDLLRQSELQAVSSLIALEAARLSNSRSGGGAHGEARRRLQQLEERLCQLRDEVRAGTDAGSGLNQAT